MSATIHQEISGALLTRLTREIRARTPRAEAAREIEIDPLPMRTCYETMSRLRGPSDSVLDYAAYLFRDDTRPNGQTKPPLEINEAQLDAKTGELSLVLTRGTFVDR